MKKHITKILFLLFFLVSTILIEGCNSGANPSAFPPSPQLTSTLVRIPTLTKTNTLIPTATSTETPTYTLSEKQLQDRLISLLQESNENCFFPCLWGILPNKSKWLTAQSLLADKGVSITALDFRDDWKVYYNVFLFSGTERGIVGLEFFVRDDVVDIIHVSSDSFADTNSYHRVFVKFSPEAIISSYGPPSRIWLDSDFICSEGKSCPHVPYTLIFFYDHQGFVVEYTGSVKFEGIYHFCPSFQNEGNLDSSLDFYAGVPEKFDDIEGLIDSKFINRKPLDLTVAAGITIDEFVSIFSSNSRSVCFTTPRGVWK